MVRHPVVARIVRAYEVHDAEQERLRKARKEEAKEEALRLQREQAVTDEQSNSQPKDQSPS